MTLKIKIKSSLQIFLILQIFLVCKIFGQENSDCMTCHEDKTLKGTRYGKTISVFLNEKILKGSVHSEVDCIQCHVDLEGSDFPHDENVKRAKCNNCHDDIQKLYDGSLHAKAFSRGDRLAPICQDCHGAHDIIPVNNLKSVVAPINVPYLCGKCHKEGSPVQLQRNIAQTHILENYSESIHGEGLLRKGLVVTATCASCHTAHEILPHTDSKSSIARKNIANTCAKCHAEIELVHRKVIKGALWEKEVNVLPACVDCHQPHKARRVFYDQGMADADCLTCHEKKDLRSSENGRSLYVNYSEIKNSRHTSIACSQCHSGVKPSHTRPCDELTASVDCASCHTSIQDDFEKSAHGILAAKQDPNAPTCKECHSNHNVLGKLDPKSPIFPINIPTLCGKCHREGEKAAVRYKGTEREIITNYTESIHGKGLMKSGLTVTATCTDCHTSHKELPHTDPASSVNSANIAATCGNCHHGIQEKFEQSIHSPLVSKTDKKLPTCENCHSAHKIKRADSEGFKLTIMNQCGNCHKQIADTYFDTYHGKVTQLGYTKTAKCYDCHGAHDILPVENPLSHLNRKNVVETCKKCHPNANRQFAGYFTHATHHDPEKYPWLFWTFWGMTGLLVGTFVIAGLHTLLWLPRSLKWRRELKRRQEENNNQSQLEDNNNAGNPDTK
ncbi:MAG: cytochrome c3 family protein [Ignavibacteriaceae bacterium]|nr:cytochrome c3 family protein [Ignavibacteriaceae bacterium]